MEERRCIECGCVLEDTDDDMCHHCRDLLATMIINEDSLWPNGEDFL